MKKFLYSLFYGTGQAMENEAQYSFARENLPKEQFEKLHHSRRCLCAMQAVPFVLLAIFLICVFLFVPTEEKINGSATMRETYLLFGTTIFIFFLIFWLILSQFVGGGRLWVKYAAWFRRSADPVGDLPKLLEILDGKK